MSAVTVVLFPSEDVHISSYMKSGFSDPLSWSQKQGLHDALVIRLLQKAHSNLLTWCTEWWGESFIFNPYSLLQKHRLSNLYEQVDCDVFYLLKLLLLLRVCVCVSECVSEHEAPPMCSYYIILYYIKMIICSFLFSNLFF